MEYEKKFTGWIDWLNVTIDRMECVSCGACWNICPDLFEQNPCDSFSQIAEPFRFCNDRAEGIVPENPLACASEAVNLCPVQIITISRDEYGELSDTECISPKKQV